MKELRPGNWLCPECAKIADPLVRAAIDSGRVTTSERRDEECRRLRAAFLREIECNHREDPKEGSE